MYYWFCSFCSVGSLFCIVVYMLLGVGRQDNPGLLTEVENAVSSSVSSGYHWGDYVFTGLYSFHLGCSTCWRVIVPSRFSIMRWVLIPLYVQLLIPVVGLKSIWTDISIVIRVSFGFHLHGMFFLFFLHNFNFQPVSLQSWILFYFFGRKHGNESFAR